jgi:hypothetical protein
MNRTFWASKRYFINMEQNIVDSQPFKIAHQMNKNIKHIIKSLWLESFKITLEMKKKSKVKNTMEVKLMHL